MQFNPGDNTGIVDEINDICNSDNNSFPLKSKARRVNSALDRFFTLAFQADARWNFDDLNQTTAPLQSISLVSGTQKYAIDTFASEIINVLRVEVLDSGGNAHTLRRLEREGTEEALTAYRSGGGTPGQYDWLGKYIYLYPAPNYSISNGLSLYFERNKSAFASTDTTKSPGIPSIFHEYICRYASLPYLIEKQRAQKNDVAAQIQVDEQAILNYFANREKGVRRSLTAMVEDTR